MIKRTDGSLKMRPRTLAMAVATLVTAVSLTASAAFAIDTVGIVEYSQGHLLIQTSGNGVNYEAFTALPSQCASTAGAAAVTIDTLKTWQSLGQSALLAGKTIRVYFVNCAPSSTNIVTALDLNK